MFSGVLCLYKLIASTLSTTALPRPPCPRCDNQKYLQIVANVPRRQNRPPWRTTGLEEFQEDQRIANGGSEQDFTEKVQFGLCLGIHGDPRECMSKRTVREFAWCRLHSDEHA